MNYGLLSTKLKSSRLSALVFEKRLDKSILAFGFAIDIPGTLFHHLAILGDSGLYGSTPGNIQIVSDLINGHQGLGQGGGHEMARLIWPITFLAADRIGFHHMGSGVAKGIPLFIFAAVWALDHLQCPPNPVILTQIRDALDKASAYGSTVFQGHPIECPP